MKDVHGDYCGHVNTPPALEMAMQEQEK